MPVSRGRVERVDGRTVLTYGYQGHVLATARVVADVVSRMDRHELVEFFLELGSLDSNGAEHWHAVGADLSERLGGSGSARQAWWVLRTLLNGVEQKEGADAGNGRA